MMTMRLSTIFLLLMALFSVLSVLEYVILEGFDDRHSLRSDTGRSLSAFLGRTINDSFRSKNSSPASQSSKASHNNPLLSTPLPRKRPPQQSLKELRKQRNISKDFNAIRPESRSGSMSLFSGRIERERSMPSYIESQIETMDLASSNHTENRIIYYLHIHKSAGSTMCIGAQKNGMKVSDKNCNVQRDQRCCGGGDDLASQEAYALSTDKDFVANEQDMYEAMDMVHYRYVVTLRKSRDRYLSHWKNVVRLYYPNYMTNFSTWWQQQPDNWNFRKICGSRCMFVPKFRITEDLFQYTVERLNNFEDILIFEHFNETFTTFAYNVGWEKMPLTKGGKKKNVTYPDSGGAWDPLMTALDDALYEIGEARARGQSESSFSVETLQSIHRYFEQGKLRECNSPCCSSVCSQY